MSQMSWSSVLDAAGGGQRKGEGAGLPNKKAIGWVSKYYCTLPAETKGDALENLFPSGSKGGEGGDGILGNNEILPRQP